LRQEAICYSDGATAVSSAIPAFCKKGDLLLVDEACSEPILTGCNLSRSTVHFFKHNDMNDLRCILESIADDDKRLKRDTLQQRRFIIVEGIFRNTGDICPLSEIVRLKEEFCYRMILDETLSFGTMGKSGRGVTELFSVNPSDVDIIILSLDTTLASVGGVCVGTREIVDHQRLSGAGYCFSASAPPFLSSIASLALKKMEEQPELLLYLNRNCVLLYDKLKKIKSLKMLSGNVSPVFCLVLQTKFESLIEEREVVNKIAQLCVVKGVGITAGKFPLSNRFGTERPSLTFCASSSLSETDISKIVSVLSESTAAFIY
jgi:serine palmitoyltransferase